MKKQLILSVIYHVAQGKARELLRSLNKIGVGAEGLPPVLGAHGRACPISDRGEEGFKADGFLKIKRDAMLS